MELSRNLGLHLHDAPAQLGPRPAACGLRGLDNLQRPAPAFGTRASGLDETPISVIKGNAAPKSQLCAVPPPQSERKRAAQNGSVRLTGATNASQGV